MVLFIKTIISYFLYFLVCLVFSLICLPLVFLPEKIRYNRIYFFLTYIWNKLLLFFSFMKVEIKNKGSLPKYLDKPAIFVMNHASVLDVFCVEALMKNYPHIWIGKESLGKIPLFGILMKRMHVLVQRENPRMAIKALLKVYRLVKDKPVHILFFPEGKRYSDGNVHNFLSGFAILAKKLNRPVIPIKIVGTNKIFPKNQFIIDSDFSPVKLIVGKPFYYKRNETEKLFVVRVHDWFI